MGNPRHRLGGLMVLAFLWIATALPAQSSSGAYSVRLDLEGGGAILVKSPKTSSEGVTSQILQEKPGGAKILLAETNTFDFTDLKVGDLDGDQVPEIIAIAKNRGTDDFLPYIFQGQTDLKQVFPPREEDNPLMGKEISIIPGKDSSSLCIKILVPFHDFGPPELYVNHLYKIQNGVLTKTQEQVGPVLHFNQHLNLASHFFHRGDYLHALKEFQGVLASHSTKMPPEALAEAYFYQGETFKYLKDFTQALGCYDQVLQQYPETPAGERAQEEHEFLSMYRNATEALSLWIDVSRQEGAGKHAEALNLLEMGMKAVPMGNMEDTLLLQKGKIQMATGRADEALKTFKHLRERFPQSPQMEEVETLIQELEIPPDETQ